MRHPGSSRREELPHVCGAGVRGVFGVCEQMEALGVGEVMKKESLVWLIEVN